MEPISKKKKVEQWESVIAQLHKIILDDCYDKLVNPLAWRVQLLERKLDHISTKEAKSELKEFQEFLQHMKGWRKDGE